MFAALQQLWATQQSRQGGEESGDGKKTYVFNNKIDVHVNGATDAGSFQAAQDQIIGTMMRKIRTVTQRNF
jgi:N-acetylglucosamine-6-phosphate deacetylase